MSGETEGGFHAFSRGATVGTAGVLGLMLAGPVGGALAALATDCARERHLRENFKAWALGTIIAVFSASCAASGDHVAPELSRACSSFGLAGQWAENVLRTGAQSPSPRSPSSAPLVFR
jgi:hypothetical protein